MRIDDLILVIDILFPDSKILDQAKYVLAYNIEGHFSSENITRKEISSSTELTAREKTNLLRILEFKLV